MDASTDFCGLGGWRRVSRVCIAAAVSSITKQFSMMYHDGHQLNGYIPFCI